MILFYLIFVLAILVKNTELFESGLNLDILKSNINIWKNLENNLRHYVNNYKGSSIILRYENFYNDYDYIFNELGKLIDLDDLSDSFKQQIIDSTNINKNKKNIKKNLEQILQNIQMIQEYMEDILNIPNLNYMKEY